MDERRLEIKVGILLVAAALGGLGLLYLLGEFSFVGGQAIYVDFAHSGGVPDGAPVRLAGVRVGRVRELTLLPSRVDEKDRPLPVRMQVEIARDVFGQLRSDSKVVVATQGPLGEPFLEISPGSPGAEPLRAGTTLRGVDPPRMDLLMAQVASLLDSASAVMGEADPEALRALVSDARQLSRRANEVLDQAGPAAVEATHELLATARELKALTTQASEAMRKGGEVRRLLADAAALSAELRREVPALMATVQKAAANAEAMSGAITEEDLRGLREALSRYQQAGASLSSLAERADGLMRSIDEGQGTLGALVKDPKLYEDLKALVTDLKRHPWKVLWKD